MFNKGLYKEGLRQGRLVGIIFFAVIALFSIIIPVSNLFSVDDGRIFISWGNFNPLFILTFCLFAPLLTLSVFSFLNKRNQSDFYHSIPHKRQTLFFSYLMSLLTWLIGTIVICSLISFGIYLAGGNRFVMNYSEIFKYILTSISSSIMVMGAVLISMGLTGTMFSNIIVALLIIFMPRVVISMFLSCANEFIVIADLSTSGFFGTYCINVPFELISYLFGMSSSLPLTNLAGGIYTLILGIIYIVIAGLLFKHRKSEAAGNSALNPKTQTTIRIALAFLISMVGTTAWLNSNNFSLLIFTVYAISLIAYFAYEIISTKKLAGIVKAIPALAILVLLNVAAALGVHLVKNVTLGVDWNSSYIESVQLNSTVYQYGIPAYETLKSKEIELNSPEVINAVSNQLSTTQTLVKTNKRSIYNLNMNPGYIATVNMKNGKSYTRYIYGDDEFFSNFANILTECDYNNMVYGELPKEPTSITSYSFYSIPFEKMNEVYECYKEEVSALSIDDWVYLNTYNGNKNVSSQFLNNSYSVINNLYVSGLHNGQKYESQYPLGSFTPKTLKMLIEMNNAENEKFSELWEDVKANGITENSKCQLINYYMVMVYSTHEESDVAYFDQYMDQYSDFDSEATKETISFIDKLINNIDNAPIDEKTVLVDIVLMEKNNADAGTDEYYITKEYKFSVPMSTDEYKELSKLSHGM